MRKPPFLLLPASLALLGFGLSACNYDNWDNTPPKNEIPGGWDDIRFLRGAQNDASPSPSLAQAIRSNPTPDAPH
jgi:hypothetical protein